MNDFEPQNAEYECTHFRLLQGARITLNGWYVLFKSSLAGIQLSPDWWSFWNELNRSLLLNVLDVLTQWVCPHLNSGNERDLQSLSVELDRRARGPFPNSAVKWGHPRGEQRQCDGVQNVKKS